MNIRGHRRLMLWLTLILIHCGANVLGMNRIFRANTRWYVKGNIKLIGTIIDPQNIEYRVAVMGTSSSPFYSNPAPVCVVINGVTTSLNVISIETLLTSGQFDARDTSDREWPTGTKVYSCPGHSFWVFDGRILQVVLRSHLDYNTRRSINPIIGPPNCENLVPMPITEGDARRIFGPPDEIKDFFAQ